MEGNQAKMWRVEGGGETSAAASWAQTATLRVTARDPSHFNFRDREAKRWTNGKTSDGLVVEGLKKLEVRTDQESRVGWGSVYSFSTDRSISTRGCQLTNVEAGTVPMYPCIEISMERFM